MRKGRLKAETRMGSPRRDQCKRTESDKVGEQASMKRTSVTLWLACRHGQRSVVARFKSIASITESSLQLNQRCCC